MKKISLKKLRANFTKLILDILMQLSFTLVVLAITGILVPFTIHGHVAAMIAESIAYSIMACGAYIISLANKDGFKMSTAIKDLHDTLSNNLTPKNFFKAALKRIVSGVATGIMTFFFSGFSIVMMYLLFPRQLASDVEELQAFHSKYDLTRANIAVHAPVYEEAVHRSYQLSLLKVALHVAYFLYSAAKELYEYITGAPEVTTDFDVNRVEQEEIQVLVQEQEQSNVENLNKYVNNSANLLSAMSFSKGHLPTQYLHTFVSGLAYGNLANEYGDIVAPVVAHMTHNAIPTLNMN